MNFSEALEKLKSGDRIARSGWNGKNMWLCHMPATTVPAEFINGRTKRFWPYDEALPVGAYIVMRTADGTWQPGWLASQADILAVDWCVVDEPPAG